MSSTTIVLVMLISIIFNATSFKMTNSNGRMYNRNTALSMKQQKSSAKQFIALGILSTFLGTSSMPLISNAANYAEVLDPKTAVLSEEANSADVKEGLLGLSTIKNTIDVMIADLTKDSQTDLVSRLDKDLNAGSIRQVLNKFNGAFSEDTQRGTDRLIRAIVQDISELNRDAGIKEGKARSQTKTNIILKRLNACSTSLDQLALFYPNK